MSTGDATECPSFEILQQCAAGAVIDQAVLDHLDACNTCAAEVERARADNDLLRAFIDANADQFPGLESPQAPDVLAGYELLSEIHRGGQGVVYQAIQKATKRTVAVKMLVQGTFATSRQRRRFEREVELAASLRHPNIVTIHDSGLTSDGRHFLVMEYIEGAPLATTGGDLSMAGDSQRQSVQHKLALFIKVCQAVNHAHQRGIIHRDLKPANIVVDDRFEPHVLDFGVAKPLRDHGGESATLAGEFVGTFSYAAPEQLAGDPDGVDIRTDVYALGVILYELLTHQRPYPSSASVADLIRQITDRDPVRPSNASSRVDHELETIILKALDRAPQRRYQSAAALAEDVQLYLAGKPISAKRDHTAYVIWKTARRYKKTVAVAVGFVLLLMAFSLTTWVQYRQTAAAEQARMKEALKVTETLESFVAVLGSFDQENPQAQVTVSSIRDLLDEAARIVSEQLQDYPEIEAALRSSLGLAYLGQSQFEQARVQLAEALRIRRTLHAGDHADVAAAFHNMGRYFWKVAAYDQAQDMYRQALAMRQAVRGAEHGEVAASMHHLAATLHHLREDAEAERLYRTALAMRVRLLGQGHPEVANNLNGLGTFLRERGRHAEAASCFRQAWHIIRRQDGEADWRVARAMHNLGACLIDQQALDEARQLLADSMAMKRALHGEDHPSVAKGLYELARLSDIQGDARLAEDLCRQAIRIQQAKFPNGHDDLDASRALLEQIQAAGRRASGG